MLPDFTEISSTRTVGDWRAVRPVLKAGADAATWAEAVNGFYRDRLNSRYLDPIRAIQAGGGCSGEGFAIVAILCSLIEFLESCYQGINYVHKKPEPPYQYNQSGPIFVTFFAAREPFCRRFSVELAQEFYESVRCGVLHEARTKKRWRIHSASGSGLIVDPTNEILYRDDFQDAVIQAIDDYSTEVPRNAVLQAAFIRKYDHLCD